MVSSLHATFGGAGESVLSSESLPLTSVLTQHKSLKFFSSWFREVPELEAAAQWLLVT